MKRVIYIVIVIILIFIINNFVHSIYSLWNKQDILVKAQKELEAKKKENNEIKKKLANVESEDFVEKEARNKLFLVKPGESQVLIPEDLLKASESAKEKENRKPNWQKWWELFFN